MSSTSAGAAAGAADVSSHSAWPQPLPSAADKRESKLVASLRAQLAASREREAAYKGERDDARSQNKLALVRIASLEREKAVAAWVMAAELVDGFDRALPFGGLDEVATIQEMVHVKSPLSSTAKPRLPIELIRLIIKASCSTADLFSWALVCFDVLEVAMEELAHRPIVFDLRKRKSGIESFLGPRWHAKNPLSKADPVKERVPNALQHNVKYDRITLVVEFAEPGLHEQVPVPSLDRVHDGFYWDSFIEVGTLVLNVVATTDGRFPDSYDCDLPWGGIGNLLYLFKPDVYHSHADVRGLPASSVEFGSWDRPLAVEIEDKGLCAFHHYQTAVTVYSGCSPENVTQNGSPRPLYGWCETGFRRKDGSARIQWSPYPAKIVFVAGGAHRDGIAWEDVEPRHKNEFDSEDSSDDSPLVDSDDWRMPWYDNLMSYPVRLGIAIESDTQDNVWLVPHKPIQAFAVEIWVAEDVVNDYNHAFGSIPLFARMKTANGEPITWKAFSLESKRASTDKQDVEIIKGLGGIDGD